MEIQEWLQKWAQQILWSCQYFRASKFYGLLDHYQRCNLQNHVHLVSFPICDKARFHFLFLSCNKIFSFWFQYLVCPIIKIIAYSFDIYSGNAGVKCAVIPRLKCCLSIFAICNCSVLLGLPLLCSAIKKTAKHLFI